MVEKIVDASGLLRAQFVERVLQPHATDQVRPIADRKKEREDSEQQRRDRFEHSYFERQRPLWEEEESGGGGEERQRPQEPPVPGLVPRGRQLELPGLQGMTLPSPARPPSKPGQNLDLEA